MEDEKLLNINQAAALVQMTPETVRIWARAGKISFYKIGGRYRFKREDLEEALRLQHHKAKVLPDGRPVPGTDKK